MKLVALKWLCQIPVLTHWWCHIFRRDVLDHLLQLQNFQNQFLPNALRKLFCNISAPNNRGEYLSEMIDKFSDRFCHCNPKLGLDKGKNLMGIVIYMTKWVLILYFSVVVDENVQGYFSSQYELVPSECKLKVLLRVLWNIFFQCST